MGGVFSQKEGFTSINQLWGAFAFHLVATGVGTGLIGRAVATNKSQRSAQAALPGEAVRAA